MTPHAQQNQRPARIAVLRYRFDSPEQATRHFHVVGGRVVLFFPTARLFSAGDAVLLEVAFQNSEQHCVLRGTALGKGTSAHHGWWLEFSAHGLVTGLRTASTEPKRRHRRFPTDALASVEYGERLSVVARLLDIGTCGARLAGAGLRSIRDHQVRVILYSRSGGPPCAVAADIAWARAGDLGVRFRPSTAAERRAIEAVIEDARAALLGAQELTHPAICPCAEGGAVLEPSLPRSAHRPSDLA